jgi:hypothetical protein
MLPVSLGISLVKVSHSCAHCLFLYVGYRSAVVPGKFGLSVFRDMSIC